MATKLVYTMNFAAFDCCKDQVCIDLGANEGEYVNMALDYGAAKVYAFEAGHKMCIRMKERFASDPVKKDKVIIEEYAVSNEQSVLKNVTWINAWMLGDPKTANYPVSPGACDIEGYELVSIPTISLDYYFAGSDEKIGFMKIDVDGYEFKAMQGAKATIMKHRPIIFIELSFYIDQVPNSSVKEFFELIKELKYVFVDLHGTVRSYEYVEQEFPWHSSCDIFIIPEEQKDTCSIIAPLQVHRSK